MTVEHREPSYLKLFTKGELTARVCQAVDLLKDCRLCPRACGVDRLSGGTGVLPDRPPGTEWRAFAPHFGEEAPLVGSHGSGTIFFSSCNLLCSFCQNYDISHLRDGVEVDAGKIAGMMLPLARRGCHNINFVTPSHVVPQILEAVVLAAGAGLRLPLVYNTSGFEAVETLRLLENVVDIWLPDAKYTDDAVAQRLSGFPHYAEHNRAALREVFRQVGDRLILDEEGIARRGMIVRHLVLPGGLADTPGVLRWIASELSPAVHISLMDQYFPAYQVLDHPLLGRKITTEEYEAALDAFDASGLNNGWMQEHDDCLADEGA